MIKTANDTFFSFCQSLYAGMTSSLNNNKVWLCIKDDWKKHEDTAFSDVTDSTKDSCQLTGGEIF